jgi:hypothetical protein
MLRKAPRRVVEASFSEVAVTHVDTLKLALRRCFQPTGPIKQRARNRLIFKAYLSRYDIFFYLENEKKGPPEGDPKNF